MKVFSPTFETEPVVWHPHEPHQWEAIKTAQSAYLEFCLECLKFGTTPAVLRLYAGGKVGNECSVGYPEFHDMELRFTKQGTVRMFRIKA